MKNTKSLGLIGAGHWGKNLARNFYQLGALNTICDSRPSIIEIHKQQFPDVSFTSNPVDIFNNPSIDKVVIATPAALHYSLAKQALNANKDVYVEKPLCLNSAEGEELNTLAQKNGRILMVGHLLQYHPCIIHVQELVARGELGKLQYIVSNRLNLGSIRTEENALWNFAPHDISVILSLCHYQLPEQVRCVGGAYLSKGVADTTLTTLRFNEDLRAHIYVSWLHPFKEQKLIVVGSSAMVVFDDTKPWNEKLIMHRNHIKWAPGSTGQIPQANGNEGEKLVVNQVEPLKEECLHFLKCCDERKIPKTDGNEGLRVLKVLQAAQASLLEDGEAKNPAKQHQLSLAGTQYFAHETAVVHPTAEVGQDTKIWHFSHVMENTKIGMACNIGQNVVVSPGVVLGNGVKVQNNVSIYSGVICEDEVFLGPSMVFTNVINPRSAINRRGQYHKTIVKKGATIGANATIVCDVELGEHCFVGAGAVVTKDVKPYALVVGNPARQIGWMSKHGERLDLPLKAKEGQRMVVKCVSGHEEYVLENDELHILTR